MKIGFLGIGNMGGSILKGFLKNGVDEKNIFIYDVDQTKIKYFQEEYGVTFCEKEKLAKSVDFLILAIKPDIILTVLKEIKSHIKKDTVIISIAAGVSIDKILNVLGYEAQIVRVMPNINAEITLSTTSYCYENVTDENLKVVVDLLEKIGSVYYVTESKFNIFTAIAGCSPAYVYLFIDSLAKGAQKMGLNKKESLKIAIDAVIGSATMLKETNKHPWELIDNVCSPGGTTIEGICTLEENNFQQTIVKAVENTIKKDISLNNS